MTCTWTVSRQYSDYVNIQGRGDGGVLEHMYTPAKNGTRLVGEAIYINYFDASSHTVTAPTCDGYLAGQSCNGQVALTKYLYVDKQCFDDCKWAEIGNDADMSALGTAMITAQLGTLLPLIYADMIANGTASAAGSATPTGAQVLAAISVGILAIAANGGFPGAIVLDLTYSGATVLAMAGLFQNWAGDYATPYGPGRIGTFLGYPVYVTPGNLATAAATPVNVAALVWAKNGFAYAYEGENFGLKMSVHPETNEGTNDVLLRMCVGYKTLAANLVYYVTQA